MEGFYVREAWVSRKKHYRKTYSEESEKPPRVQGQGANTYSPWSQDRKCFQGSSSGGRLRGEGWRGGSCQKGAVFLPER